MNEYERLTVVIADPQLVMRIGLYTLLESYAVCVVGEAAGPAAAAELVATLKPAVVLIAPGRHGISMHLSAWDRLRELPAPIVAYLSRSSEAPAAALAGVDSCLLKSSAPDLLHDTLLRTVRGERLWLPGEHARPADLGRGRDDIDRLGRQGEPTLRERQILALLLEHCSDQEIAERLVVSRNTVKTHVCSVLRKLDLPDRRALLRTAAPSYQ